MELANLLRIGEVSLYRVDFSRFALFKKKKERNNSYKFLVPDK